MKYPFYFGVVLVVAFGILLINNLPTIFDIVTLGAGTVGGVVTGRKSRDWF